MLKKNSYDELAKDWTKRIRAKKNLAHEFLEKPAMYAKLPDLKDQSVLCLGCGSGEECQKLLELGAKKVIGIDSSKGLVEQAKYAFPDVEFHVMDMAKLNFKDATFDFVYSSLVLHYAKDWQPTLQQIHRVLKKNGTFLFSTHHPVKWGAEKIRDKNTVKSLLGYTKHDDSEKVEIFGDYLNTRQIKATWFDKLDVVFYHKPLSEIMREIRDSGFEILDFLEPKAIDSVKKIRPDFWELHQKIPLFMIFELRKK
jgi:SAM-dependent methyltransferase